MKAITIEGLRKDFDEAEAVEIYDKVASIGGFGVFNNTFRPALDVAGLSESKQVKVAELVGKPVEPKEEKPDAAESLAKNNSRETLDKMAKEAGLDGNKYTDKLELSKAIIAKKEAK